MKRIARLMDVVQGVKNPERQIRQTVSHIYGVIILAAVCLLLPLFFKSEGFFPIMTAVIVLIYGFLSFRNDRVEYDDTGITLYSLWGKPYQVGWHDVISVDVSEEMLISKSYLIGNVLRIICKHGKRERTYRFPYQYYSGIIEFISFVESKK